MNSTNEVQNNSKENILQDFNPDVVINGRQYFYSPAQQLAKHICKKYDEYKLSCEYEKHGFLSAAIYFEQLLQAGSCFEREIYGKPKCIGVLNYDIDTNKILLIKTNVNPEIHEFHKDDKRAMNECFGIQYEIFKYLRDPDIIIICSSEKEGRKKVNYTYTINKLKAAKCGRFLHFKGQGTQFFIPKTAFKKVQSKRGKCKGK